MVPARMPAPSAVWTVWPMASALSFKQWDLGFRRLSLLVRGMLDSSLSMFRGEIVTALRRVMRKEGGLGVTKNPHFSQQNEKWGHPVLHNSGATSVAALCADRASAPSSRRGISAALPRLRLP